MRRYILDGLYNLIIFPLLFIFYHLYGLINAKARRGIIGRYRTFRQTADFLKTLPAEKPDIYLLHCASMGEFEHIKPFIRSLKERRPSSKLIVMFFSPSGYEHVRQFPGVDLFIYAPFDWKLTVMRFFKLVNPSALIIAKYDAWPNQVWTAAAMGIPRVLINGTIYRSSGRLNPLVRWFQQSIYEAMDLILVISDSDRDHYRKLAPAEKILLVGDSKFDQVIFRSEESRKKVLIPPRILQNRRILVAGSTWPADEHHLVPAIKNLADKYPDFLAIVCPHEPTTRHIEQLKRELQPLKVCLYSQLAMYHREPVLVIDSVGMLANLYSLADAAFVGGGFKQNVHNVLEPAAYGIPVLFGPINENSSEAQLLLRNGAAKVVRSDADIFAQLNKMFTLPEYRSQMGNSARQIVNTNSGATERMINAILIT